MNPVTFALFGIGGSFLAYKVTKQIYNDWVEVKKAIIDSRKVGEDLAKA